jgi:hypothetical protein
LKPRNGTVLILAFIAILAGGWGFYRHFIPPTWLRNFAADIALRAAADPNAPPPRDTREATPRGLADHPYICLRKLIPFPWDRFVVVPSGGDPRTTPALLDAAWSGNTAAKAAKRMAKDRRYQMVVLIKDGRVIAHEYFYTFWGDLSALARPEGFGPDTAVFTAAVKDGRYVLAPVGGPLPAACS